MPRQERLRTLSRMNLARQTGLKRSFRCPAQRTVPSIA
jgi:hypothetical protein